MSPLFCQLSYTACVGWPTSLEIRLVSLEETQQGGVVADSKSDVWPVMRSLDEKIQWAGRLVAVQPRIRLTRSFDERSHTYQGYVLRVQGTLGKVSGEFLVAVGPTAHAKHRFRVGDEVQGIGHPVVDPRMETAEIYKVSGLKVLMRTGGEKQEGPPWLGVPPSLQVYRARGHRRLAAGTYETKCQGCIWGM